MTRKTMQILVAAAALLLLAGLLLVAALFATILWRGLRQHRRLRDPRLKAVSAAILAFLVVTMAAAAGKPYLDYDPINVYFWLLAGVLAKLAVLDRDEAPAPA